MKRKLAIAGIIVAVVLSLGSFLLYHFMTGPMYKSGQVRAEHDLTEPLDPPQQPEGATTFQVSDDIQLHRFESGEGKTALVIHGGPGFPPSKPYAGLELLEGTRFVYYHQRGCGESTRPFDRIEDGMFEGMKKLESKLGLGAQLGDIERIRRILGQEKLVLVGHSFGALIAALYAAEFPERVAAMVLVAPATIMKMPGDHPDLFASIRERLAEERRPAFDEWLESYLDMGALFDMSESEIAARTREMGPFWVEAVSKEGVTLPDEEMNIENNGGWMGFAMFFSMGMRHDYTPHLANVKAPVLVVHGEKDLQTEAATREYVDYFPNAEFTVVEGVGHFPFLEAPERFARVVTPFFEKLP